MEFTKNINAEIVLNNIIDDKLDKFAKTFIAKCNMLNKWEDVVGCWDGNNLCGIILVTISKRSPYCANLQLLHTFSKYRKLGVGKKLCEYVFSMVKDDAEYFRVSSEPESVGFYKKIGFRFWGLQKSNCYLSLFKINGNSIFDGIYDSKDKYIISKINPSKLKGSLVKVFEELY